MKKTAVGLFRDPGAVDQVIREIEGLGLPRNEVYALGEPLDLAVHGVTSIPRIDFEVALTRELLRIGASRSQAEAWIDGVRRQGTLVFATGADERVDRVAEIMNRHGAVNTEETTGPEPVLPHVAHAGRALFHDSPVQAGRVLEPAGGAAFFIW